MHNENVNKLNSEESLPLTFADETYANLESYYEDIDFMPSNKYFDEDYDELAKYYGESYDSNN